MYVTGENHVLTSFKNIIEEPAKEPHSRPLHWARAGLLFQVVDLRLSVVMYHPEIYDVFSATFLTVNDHFAAGHPLSHLYTPFSVNGTHLVGNSPIKQSANSDSISFMFCVLRLRYGIAAAGMSCMPTVSL
jgi:hypothetical protein